MTSLICFLTWNNKRVVRSFGVSRWDQTNMYINLHVSYRVLRMRVCCEQGLQGDDSSVGVHVEELLGDVVTRDAVSNDILENAYKRVCDITHNYKSRDYSALWTVINNVTWASWNLKSAATVIFVQAINKKTSNSAALALHEGNPRWSMDSLQRAGSAKAVQCHVIINSRNYC